MSISNITEGSSLFVRLILRGHICLEFGGSNYTGSGEKVGLGEISVPGPVLT